MQNFGPVFKEFKMIKPNKDTENVFEVRRPSIEAALRRATRDALLAHKRAGVPIAIWRDGKVVTIPAEEIEIPPLEEGPPSERGAQAGPNSEN
jgi:hypothetical protein